uniref:Minor tail protein n=1 Tax=Myoviridae sp. ctJfU3 TaxID=2826638 RepID=A0A8S5MNN2_9CAUD|nr:MAG TPA: minor tail protein [Myoviridae sp. ctJfU3]
MAASTIKGITIEIGGDTTKLDKALSGVNKQSRDLQRELKEVEKGLKLDPKNTELLAQKQTLLKEAVAATSEKLDVLKTAEAQVQKQFKNGEVSEEQYRALQREIIKTESDLKSLKKAAEDGNSVLEKVGEITGKIGEKSEALGKKLLPVTGAIVGIGAASTAAFNELDAGYDTIITKTGASGDALESLQGSMDAVFSSLPTEAETAGIAIGEVNTRFGATGKVLEDLSSKFIQFSEINGTDLNGAIDSVDAIMTKFGVDSSYTGEVLGLLTKAGQDTGISMDALQNTLQTNGAILKEMGLDLTSSVNLLAQFESNGVDATTALAGLKKAQQNATADGKNLKDALGETIEKIKNASDETKALQIATELFGKKGAAEMTQAIREGRLSVEDLSGALSDYGNVVEDTFNATLDPPDQAKVALNNLKVAGADLGNTLMQTLAPILERVVEKVKDFTQWFKNLSDTQKETIIKIGAVVAAIGPALIIFGKLSSGVSGAISVFSKLSGTFKTAGTAGKGLWAVLSANPIGAVVAAVAALVAGFVLMYQKCEWFREMVNEAFAQIKTSVSETIEKIKPILQQLGESFKNLLEQLKPVFQFIITYVMGMIQGALSALQPLISAVKNAIDFVSNIISAFMALFRGDLDGFANYISAAVQNLIEYVKNIILSWVNLIITFFQSFGVDVKQIFSDIWSGIKTIFANVGTWFGDRFREAYTAITTIFASVGQWFGQRWLDIQNALSNVASWFLTIFTNAYTNVTNAFASVGQWFGQRWLDIQNALSSVADWFGAQFQNAWENIKRAFANVGEFFGGIWNNIKQQFTNVGTNIGNAIGGAFKSAMNSVLITVENAVNRGIGFINSAIGVINKIPGVSVGSIGAVSLPRLAKGGVLKNGQAIMAEAGPELISMVNGQAIVTPLTQTARNTAMQATGQSSGYNQTINIYSPKALSPYEVARQTKNQTQKMVSAMQRR